tara:strand:+ start:797 stop:1012 length:216 start_codon:yes stop_codon:yes gene_type:complete
MVEGFLFVNLEDVTTEYYFSTRKFDPNYRSKYRELSERGEENVIIGCPSKMNSMPRISTNSSLTPKLSHRT